MSTVRKRGGFVNFVRKRDGIEDTPKKEYQSHFWFKGGRRSSHQKGLLKKILEGDVPCVISAFGWSDTPQGVLHWSGIYSGVKEMTEKDYEYIRYLIEHHT
jgi:hypothetical protein